MASELARVETPNQSSDMTKLLELALTKGVDVIALEKLVALKERTEDRIAAQEFARALAEFQSACPPIRKTSTAKIVTKSGREYGYNYAELDEIARTANKLLKDYGLSYTWDSEFDTTNMLRCTCTLRHVNGHSIKATFQCPTESDAGMSAPQKVAAALTFARRQSLVQVLGLTSCDVDSDGNDPEMNAETISVEQQRTVNDLIIESAANKDKFLKWFGVQSIEAIPTSRFDEACNALIGKAKKK